MTRKEAREQLKQIPIHDGVSDNYLKTIYEAIDIAIKSLEQQPCEDLINQRATTCRHGGHCEWVACDKCNHYEPDPLSQQPCDDCISRKAVLEIIEDCNSDGLKGIFCSYKDGKRFEKYIKELPPVTLETGHWIDTDE